MTIIVESRRKTREMIERCYPEGSILDVTSKAESPWVKFSPFYPHGNIPVPFSPGLVAESVEGIWQGLKVFESADVDTTTFHITSMKGIKRTVRRYGKVLGHRQGITGNKLLSYREARFRIYLPSYQWVLVHCVQEELAELRRMGKTHPIVLLNYETNTNVECLAKPLSHAALIRAYLTENWPSEQP